MIPVLISDHRSISATPVSAMTLQQLQQERAMLLHAEVNTEVVQVGAYKLVVEKAIQTRLTEIDSAISNGTYQKEVE